MAVDTARTARKREALQALHSEGAHRQTPAADRAAKIAATGISTDVAPALTAAIERLGAPLGEDAEALRQELQLVAVSLSRVEDVLREATEEADGGRGPAVYDISDATDDRGGGGGDGDDGEGSGEAGGKPRKCAKTETGAASTRWTKLATSGPWRRSSETSAAAAEEAKRLIQEHARAQAPAAGGTAAGDLGAAQATAPATPPASATNDLAEAERRAHLAAQQQFQQSQQQQQRQRSEQEAKHEEEMQRRRQAAQREELQRPQAKLQEAAEARALEEARQREELIARMSPQELAMAAEVHAQQNAVATQTFGTQGASHMAGLVHQSHVQNVLEGTDADTDEIVAMSPEQLAEWDRERQNAPGL